jgi:hypothetical protein
MIHTIKLVRTVPSQQIGSNYVKSLDLDNHRNILMCQMKQGQIYCIQLINQRQVKSTIIEDINSYGAGDKKDKGENKDNIAQFRWLSRMSCYCEGTKLGYMKIRDVEKKGEVLLAL